MTRRKLRGPTAKLPDEAGRIAVHPAVEADGRDEQTVAVQQVITRVNPIPEK